MDYADNGNITSKPDVSGLPANKVNITAYNPTVGAGAKDYYSAPERDWRHHKIVLPSQEELFRAADTLETMGQGRRNDLSHTWKTAANGAEK